MSHYLLLLLQVKKKNTNWSKVSSEKADRQKCCGFPTRDRSTQAKAGGCHGPWHRLEFQPHGWEDVGSTVGDLFTASPV